MVLGRYLGFATFLAVAVAAASGAGAMAVYVAVFLVLIAIGPLILVEGGAFGMWPACRTARHEVACTRPDLAHTSQM
ncbi:hypothetical protein [Streptomyces sp. NPDC004266]|uniref:hypothetical protein n=1 Tax=Streptomyces sp. NPDC004266 TaxID=3364693 RepID=UPI0036B56F0E